MANLLARAPQAHMASDRGVTWHTPTPPPHLYHVPAPSPPDPLQVHDLIKSTNLNSDLIKSTHLNSDCHLQNLYNILKPSI